MRDQPDPAGAWELRRPAAPDSRNRQPAHRPVRVAGLMGYVDPLGVKPGEKLRVHLTAPAAHEIAVARLGRPERQAEAWLAREGYAYECITDCDLDADPELDAGALAVDPGIQALTRNVLHHMGVARATATRTAG